ncbi:unnamed protein product, partial [marine sediment metagenome]
ELLNRLQIICRIIFGSGKTYYMLAKDCHKQTFIYMICNNCKLCGLCVRYCEEVKKKNAIGFVGRGINKKVVFIPESAYFKKCKDCMECMDICPTGVFPSNYGIERIPQVSDS